MGFLCDVNCDENPLAFRSVALTPPKNVEEKNDIDSRGPGGHTPLHIAVISSLGDESLSYLLEEGASVNVITDHYGMVL